jgi:hypothetical protein
MPYSDQRTVTRRTRGGRVPPAPQFARWAIDRHDGAMTIERGSTQVGIAYSREGIVVAARGSSQLGDWGENLLAIRWAWRALFPFGRVHLGFQIQARRVAAEFRETMLALRARYPRAPIYVTGHSLGGALCPFFAALLRLDGIEPVAVYTFESPRVGNSAWGRWFDRVLSGRAYRVACIRSGCADIVTRIPPSAWGWVHVGQPVLLSDGVRYGSEAAWEAARATREVKMLDQWRVVSRLAMALQAHRAGQLVDELRRIVDAGPVHL